MGTPIEPQKLLVVANPADGLAIAAVLSAAGLPEPLVGAGGDDTLSVYSSVKPDVVVLAASLTTGDPRLLADAMQSGSHGPVAPIVLVGDESGPVKTALDAADFPIDRFVRRPLSERALGIAVRDCFREALEEREPDPAPPPRDAEPGPAEPEDVLEAIASEWDDAPSVELTQQRIAEATDAAIDLFVSDAMSFLTGPVTATEPVTPAWREPTELLPAGAPRDGALEISEEDILRDELVFEDELETSPRARPMLRPPEPEDSEDDRAAQERGAFGRALREKMSEMAERLFPGQPAVHTPIDAEPAHGAHTEIDLNDLEDTASLPPVDDVFAEPERETFESGETGNGSGVITTRRSAARLEPTRGSIEDDSGDPAALIARLVAGEASGRLTLCYERTEKTVQFEHGRPVFATSNLPHDRMGFLLFREGKITHHQFEESKKISVESGRRLGEILVEAGYLKPRELLPAVRRHLEDIFYSLFAWRQGTFVFERRGDSSERIRLSRHPVALIVEGIRRKYDIETIERRMGGDGAIVIARPSDYLSSIIGVSELTDGERATVDLFDGERSIEAAARLAQIPRLTAYQLAYSLVVLSAAQVVDRGHYSASEEPAPSAALVGERDLEIDRQRVLAKRALVDEADYFELLGVRRDATSFEIRRAFETATRDYRTEMFPAELRHDLESELADIGEALEEAYAVLSDDDLRRSYSANLRG